MVGGGAGYGSRKVGTDRQPVGSLPGKPFALTEAHRMLLDVRDTLYDGSWADFKLDLEARTKGKPHVFETVPTSPDMLDTIRGHLAMIEQMAGWEIRHHTRLRSDA